MFRQFTAYFLLLLFSRILAPEQALLALHQHEHTQHHHNEKLPHIDAKHTHCQVDNLFNAPFQISELHYQFHAPLIFPAQRFVYQSVWKFTFPNNVCLRGPPAIS